MVVQGGAGLYRVVQGGEGWCWVVQGSVECRVHQPGDLLPVAEVDVRDDLVDGCEAHVAEGTLQLLATSHNSLCSCKVANTSATSQKRLKWYKQSTKSSLGVPSNKK